MFLNLASRFSTTLMLVCLMVFPQSYLPVKLVALALFVFVHALLLISRAESFVSSRDFLFYAGLCAVAVLWSIVGVARGASTEAILANLRLYAGWSMAYFLILVLIRNAGRLDVLHTSVVISVFAIALVNLIALADVMLDLGFVAAGTQLELGLTVELYDGYVRFGANNIASLFFLVGYLVAYKCFNDGRRDIAGTLALLVGMTVVVLSGRRALWLAVCMIPAITYGAGLLAGIQRKLSATGRRLMASYLLGGIAAVMAFLALSTTGGLEFLDYLQSAFSAEDERTIQARYLVARFQENPLIGSGYGGYAGYTRNLLSPWLYELTYYQILFNLGLLGSATLLAGLCYFVYLALRNIRRSQTDLARKMGILVGFLTILIGSYSNPYMQFFDSMVFIMLFVAVSGESGSVVWLRRRRLELTAPPRVSGA